MALHRMCSSFNLFIEVTFFQMKNSDIDGLLGIIHFYLALKSAGSF